MKRNELPRWEWLCAMLLIVFLIAAPAAGENLNESGMNVTALHETVPEDNPGNVTAEETPETTPTVTPETIPEISPTPEVTVAERHRLAIVAGEACNITGLKEAVPDSPLTVTLLNETEALIYNFSLDDLIFAASVDAATAEQIHTTMNQGVPVVVYDLRGSVDIGAPADAIIEAYWTNGGTENARNMLVYMDNLYFENSTPVDPPVITECPTAHIVTIVTDDLERQSSIVNATGLTNLTITLCNETASEDHDFSADELVFVASVNNETLIQIDSAVTEGIPLVVYNRPVNSTVGTPADEMVIQLWDEGGDENILELLRYLEELYFNTAEPLFRINAEDDRPKITYVFSRSSEITSMNAIGEENNIRELMNINTHHARSNEDLSCNLSEQDVILLSNLDATVAEALAPTVTAARDNGAVIISMGPLVQSYNLHTISPECNESKRMEEYLEYPSEHNYRNLALYMGATYCNLTCKAEDPENRPIYGIYHTDAPEIFSNVSSYLTWYTGTGKYDPKQPTIGIMTGDYKYVARDCPMIDALITSFENKSANVIVATYHYKDPVNIGYFMQDGDVLIDTAILISKGSRLDYGDPDRGVGNLRILNVPVLNAVRLFYDINETAWRESPHGVGPEQTYQLATAELDGIIEPIVFAGKEPDLFTGELCYEPFADQTAWLTDRAMGWMNLHRTGNANKKVIIPYYAAEAGKASVGADIDYYLDAQKSLENLLAGMKDRGYDLGGREVPTAKELSDLMMDYAHNYGTWADAELKKCVENGDVILIPEDQYLTWFNELPADKQADVRDVWGEPPGDIMVCDNGGVRSLVIPVIRFGNVMLAPDPMPGSDQNNKVLYSGSALPPTHQCIAFYTYMDRIYNADAIFSIFSIIPTLPGKECGLACTDWGAILNGDMPHIHVLPMDAEGIFDHRRANMAIVDYMTPTIVASGLYGDFADLQDAIFNYRTVVDDAVKAKYKSQIIAAVKELSIDSALEIDISAITDDDGAFESTLPRLESYLAELKCANMPYGSHTLGEVPRGESLAAMLKSMIDSDYSEHVAAAGGDDEAGLAILCLVVNGTAPSQAQTDVLGTTTAAISADLALSLNYRERIEGCTIEISRILDALEAKYIPPGPNGDPVRNPDALPTGRNLHTFDDRLIPTTAAWKVGTGLGDELISRYIDEHGEYPEKVSFLLWSIETSRHQGTMESEIFWMLGVRPIWDSRNRVKDVELITAAELGRPRVDVLVVCSGTYRDMYASKIELIDKAVRLAADADDGATPNYVQHNSQEIYETLIKAGYDDETARTLSYARIFCTAPGSYSPGIEHAIGASDTWNDPAAIAELYISNMGYVYTAGIWGEQHTDVFRDNLDDVNACIFSRTSNVYGCLEHPMVAAYFGGMNLAISHLTGESVDMYINNLRSVQDQKMETLAEFLTKDFHSRYLNPTWIEGMMGHGYDGSRYYVSLVENMWIWDVTMPGIISDGMWKDVYNTYVMDSNNLGLAEFFSENNPYALQSIQARLLDAARKGYWDADSKTLEALASEYQQSVQANGVTCCHHTCGNFALSSYTQSIVNGMQKDTTASNDDPSAEIMKDRKTIDPVGDVAMEQADAQTGAESIANMTVTDGGYGENAQEPAGPQVALPNPGVSGQVMSQVTHETGDTGPSSTPLVPILIVGTIIGAIFVGIRWKKI